MVLSPRLVICPTEGVELMQGSLWAELSVWLRKQRPPTGTLLKSHMRKSHRGVSAWVADVAYLCGLSGRPDLPSSVVSVPEQ